MKTIEQVITETEEMCFGYDDGDNWIEVESHDNNSIRLACEKLQCSPELLKAICVYTDLLRETIIDDLVAIWKRLDDLEMD